MTAPRPAIVWYRDDLRVSDHPALHAASSTHASAVVRLRARRQGARPSAARGAARWWLAQSLRALQASLREAWALRWCCGRDRRRRSSPRWRARPMPGACTGTRSRNRRIGPWPIRSPRRLARSVSPRNRFPGDLLAAPSQIRNKENRGLRVFTPFWRRVQALGDPPKPLPAPKRLNGVPNLASDELEDWELEPTRPDWAGGLARKLAARRGVGAGPPQGVPRGRHCRLCGRSRPARPGRHLKPLAASSFRRDQPAPGLACRTLCGGRAPSPVRRYRQIPQRTRLARVLPSSAVRRPRSRDAQPAARLRRLSMEARCQGIAAHGSAAGPATRSSMPGCANSGTPA